MSKNKGLKIDKSFAAVPVIQTTIPSSLLSVIIAPVACQKASGCGFACMHTKFCFSSALSGS